MPKLKTNRAAAKRFRATKNGGFKRSHAYTGHLKTAKTSKRRRGLRGTTNVVDVDICRMRRLFPYAAALPRNRKINENLIIVEAASEE
jgi:large subunit ribosomal protein L35